MDVLKDKKKSHRPRQSGAKAEKKKDAQKKKQGPSEGDRQKNPKVRLVSL